LIEKGENELKKINCWEHKKCGREPGGAKTGELGECPAAKDMSSDGLNGGENGGRICWAVAGTFCGERVQGDFAKKQVSCMACDVFKMVKNEEGSDFVLLTSSMNCT
jgi:hypothetical protein